MDLRIRSTLFARNENPNPQDHSGPSEITMDLPPNRSLWTYLGERGGREGSHNGDEVHEEEEVDSHPPDSSANA